MLATGLQLSVLLLLTVCAVPSFAQTSRLFQWAFSNNALSDSLPTCISLPIVVKSFDPTTNATQGTPPYYMIAFAVGKTPVTTFIGSDENNLSWTITEPVGEELILSVVDANGSAGGIPPRPFTVIAGSTTQCVTTPLDTPAFTVTSNITGDLQTCQPWGLFVNGGVPPYTVTLAQPNSPVVTNVTMPFGDNLFTYINRADPNGQLIAAVSDLTGRWATGTPIVNTQGSADASCVGLVSSNTISSSQPHSSSSSSNNRKRAVTIALSVTFGLLAISGMAIAGYMYLRKQKLRKQALLDNIAPHKFMMEAPVYAVRNNSNDLGISSSSWGQQLTSNATNGSVVVPVTLAHRPTLSSATGLSYITALADVNDRVDATDGQAYYAGTGQRPGFSKFPTTSIRCSTKGEEAREAFTVSPDSEYSVESVAGTLSVGQVDQRNAYRLSGIEEGRVYQGPAATHQHGGAAMMTELPPPYVGRGEMRRDV